MPKARRKSPHRHKRFILQPDVFPFRFHVQVGGLENEAFTWFAKELGAPFEPSDRDRFGAFLTYEQYPGGCLWIRKDASPGIIAHERLHAVFHSLQHIGVQPSFSSEETYCYLLDFLVDNVVSKSRGK